MYNNSGLWHILNFPLYGCSLAGTVAKVFFRSNSASFLIWLSACSLYCCFETLHGCQDAFSSTDHAYVYSRTYIYSILKINQYSCIFCHICHICHIVIKTLYTSWHPRAITVEQSQPPLVAGIHGSLPWRLRGVNGRSSVSLSMGASKWSSSRLVIKMAGACPED